jgi:hypothetical protein
MQEANGTRPSRVCACFIKLSCFVHDHTSEPAPRMAPPKLVCRVVGIYIAPGKPCQTPRYAKPTRAFEPYIIYTLRTSASFQASPLMPPTGSRTHPASVPTFLLKASSRSLPYILPLGNTTGSFSTMLLV